MAFHESNEVIPCLSFKSIRKLEVCSVQIKKEGYQRLIKERRERKRDSARNCLITPTNLESTIHLFGAQLAHTVP